MVKIYTKTGDDGTTSLLSGARVSKSDSRLQTYGEVDHFNSMIGILIQYLEDGPDKTLLLDVQNKLFDLGALLACPEDKVETFKLKKITKEFVDSIEKQIDSVGEQLPPLKFFILPGGSLAAANAHLCRTQARNVERIMVALKNEGGFIPENSLKFINRMSDYLFYLARLINLNLKVDEVIWNS